MKKNAVFVLVAMISLVALVFGVVERAGLEQKASKVELVLDYDEGYKLSEQSKENFDSWLKLFKSVGFTAVALNEESLFTLTENDDSHINTDTVGDLKRDYRSYKKLTPGIRKILEDKSVDKFDLLVMTDRKSEYDFISKGLNAGYAGIFKSYSDDSGYYILIDGTEKDNNGDEKNPLLIGSKNPERRVKSQLENMGLGFDPIKVNNIKNAGLRPILVPKNYSRQSDKLIEAYMEALREFDIKSEYMIFGSDTILGYNENLKKDDKSEESETKSDKAPDPAYDRRLPEMMKKGGIAVGMLEPIVQRGYEEQEGIKELAEDLDYNIVRVFQIVNYIQKRYAYLGYDGPQEIENTIYRAVTERNLKAVYFRPFLKDDENYVVDQQEYKESFARLGARLAQHGISFGEPSVIEFVKKTPLQLSLLGLGVVLAAVVAFEFVFPISQRIRILLLALGIAGVFSASFLKPDLSQMGLAFVSSIVFPALSIAILVDFIKKRLGNESYLIKGNSSEKFSLLIMVKDCLIVFAITVTVVLMGALFIATMLADSRYIFEINVFRGVKLSQMAPPLVFMAIYFVKFGYKKDIVEMGKPDARSFKEMYADFKALLDSHIKLWHVALFMFVAVAGVIYIARTGHETVIQASNLELMFRNILEDGLLARPRTKEFLIAFPALVLLIYFVNRKLKWPILPLGAVGAIVYGSIANTFCHIRTPIYMSLIRTKYSLLFGLLIGLILVLITNLIYNKIVYRRINNKQ